MLVATLCSAVLCVGCAAGETGEREYRRLGVDSVGTLTIDTSGHGGVAAMPVLSFETTTGTVLAVYDLDRTSLLLFEPRRASPVTTIDLAPALEQAALDAPDWVGYYVRSLDSIFVLLQPQNTILCIDTAGALRWRRTLPATRASGREYVLFADGARTPLLMRGRSLLIAQQYADGRFASDTTVRRITFGSATDLLASAGPDSSELTEVGAFPWQYQRDFYYDVAGSRTVAPDGRLVYSFGVCDSIFVVDATGRVGHAAESEYAAHAFRPFPLEDYQNPQRLRRYFVEQPRYVRIDYDPYRQLYYRIVAHRVDYAAGPGVVRTYADKPWSIVVLDRSFRRVGEALVRGGLYDFEHAFVTRDGLCVRIAGVAAPSRAIRYQVLTVRSE